MEAVLARCGAQLAAFAPNDLAGLPVSIGPTCYIEMFVYIHAVEIGTKAPGSAL